MFYVVTGGSGSGKSAYAEELIIRSGSGPRIYIATMYPYDEESHKRIARHRQMRAKKEFETVECYTDLASAQIPEDANVLLECMSNLTANELFRPEGARKDVSLSIMKGIRHLLDSCKNLIVVTNEIFSDGIRYDDETRNYQRILGDINVWMASISDHVTEIIYGIPLIFK